MTMGGAGTTTKFIVAVPNNPPGSVARTVKVLGPASGERGMPDKLPLPDTLSQAGPLTLPKLIASPLGSVALVARVAEYDCPASALATVKGLLMKVGARFVAVRKCASTWFEL